MEVASWALFAGAFGPGLVLVGARCTRLACDVTVGDILEGAGRAVHVANGFGFSLANIKPHSDLSPDGQVLKFIPIEGSVKPLRLGCIVAEGSRNVLAIDTFIEEAAKIIASWHYPRLPV